ncbi:AAA-4 family protein [Oscillochloris trichoides DG-6]|uniref:AAA-4 family protein n=1 Tax=Oscillochloris trichoides DG-6 TaxID=765420 RepID=E1IH84_9CHLR|nr:RNA-binding domain-containing protein [Oscillochloris trichoides]EFO79559.1 AAA-4 family protein [Oscillochloris trichoides DG-6]
MSTPVETRNGMRWIRADLHIHTPASEDYAEPDVSYLDILQEAERRELEIIAFTDHNTVHGYERFQREIEFLQTLEQGGRLTEEEISRLNEYRRLLAKITVLPGFEFTSHFGAHILGIFAPNRPLSLIEATLLQLGVPAEHLKEGLCGVANTRHVTEAYETIARAGGLVIAPHVNGPNGVITETLRMGTSGQSRIAATQSPHLHALEFVNFYTDHEKFTSPGFYNGKVEHYERRMFCIQGSDAHRLRRLPATDGQVLHRHGIGDRYVELLLPDNSFEALRALFASQDFDRVRVPKRDQKQWAVDAVRFGGSTERQVLRPIDDENHTNQLWCDVAALANAGGGVLVVGCEPGGRVTGVERPDHLSEQLRKGVAEQITPQPYLSFELMSYEGQDVIRVEVKSSEPPPYVCSNGAIYVRRDGETVVADRGEIIQLCRRALAEGASSPLDNGQDLDLPRSGVEIVSGQKRGGVWLYEVRDLRTTAGVTRDRAQGLWAYAISRYEDLRDGRVDVQSQVKWKGRLGLWRAYRQGSRTKYDLVHRDANGVISHIFFGVSDWGLSEAWESLLGERSGEPIEHEAQDFDREDEVVPPHPEDQPEPISPEPISWGERRIRWRGRGGLVAAYRDEQSIGRFDLVMKDKDGPGQQEYRGVALEKLTDAWLNLIRVNRPRTGIEVVSASQSEDGEWQYVFRNLRTGDVSGVPWRLQDIEPGTVREYAARMFQQDLPLDDSKVRWWGNLGYMRPMRSQVDLLFVDEQGELHFYYAARREELTGEWRDLLELYEEM